MNKKQLISLWVGVVAVAFCVSIAILAYHDSVHGRRSFIACSDFWALFGLLVVIVTGGLITTFKDGKNRENELRKPMNLKRGFRRLTLVLAILIGLFSWLVWTIIVGEKWEREKTVYNQSRSKYENIQYFWNTWDTNGWNQGKREIVRYLLDEKRPSFQVGDKAIYIDTQRLFPGIHKGMLDMPIEFLDEKAKTAKEDALRTAEQELLNHKFKRWEETSLSIIIGLSIVAGMPVGIMGFVFVWVCYFIACFIYKLIMWIRPGFRDGLQADGKSQKDDFKGSDTYY